MKRSAQTSPQQEPAISISDYIKIFQSIPVPVALTSIPEGRILEASDAWCNALGYSRAEIIGRTTLDLGVFSYPGQREQILGILGEKGGSYSGKFEFRLRSAQINPFLSTLVQLELGGKPCILTILQDISEQVNLQRVLEQSITQYRALFDNSRDAIGISRKGAHEYVNPAYLQLFGYASYDELEGRPLLDLIAPGNRDQVSEIVRARAEGCAAPGSYETRGLRKNGSEFDMEVQSSTYQINGNDFTLGLIRDITDRKQAEKKVLHLNRLYSVLSRTNKMLVRVQSEQELFDDACRIAVEYGALKMAWVGGIDDQTHLVKPVAVYGDSGDYLDHIRISVDDVPEGRGPTGTALRQGKHFICRDIEHEPYMASWRDAALAMGYRSSAAFPLKITDRVIGVYTVYASHVGWFTDDEVQLLDELASDISYALEFMERERQRREAEFTLRERLKEMTCLAEIRHAMSQRLSIDELCQQIVDKLVLAMQFPALTVSLLELDGKSFTSNVRNLPLAHGLHSDVIVHGNRRGRLSVYYLEDVAFLVPYEQNLLDGISQELSLWFERHLAEVALSASEEKFRRIVETAREGILTFDADWRVTFVNELGAEILGYTRDEMRGKCANDFVFEDDLAAYHDRRVARERGIPGLREGCYRRKDATAVCLQVSSMPIVEQGRFSGAFIMITDISARKQAEQDRAGQAEKLARLYRASGSLLADSPFDLYGLAHSILKIVAREFGQTNCAIFLVEEDSNRLVGITSEASQTGLPKKLELSIAGPGLVPLTIRKGQSLNLGDVQDSPPYALGQERTRSELTVPLKISDQVVGCIDIQSPLRDAFSADDERLMSTFSERAALALEHARTYSKMQQRLEHLGSLHMIEAAITSSFDLKWVLGVLLDQARSQLNIDHADIFIYEPATQTLELAVSREETPMYEPERLTFQLVDSLPGRVVLENRMISISGLDPNDEPAASNQTSARKDFDSYVGLPLVAKGLIKGVLEIYQRGTVHLDREQQKFMELLADQAAIAIDNAQLFENLQKSNIELRMAYDTTIEGWSQAMDLRDRETEGHTKRVTDLTLRLARAAGMREAELVHVRRGALLHDIGKLGVPDSILFKSDALTDAEWAVMRKHPVFAYQMLFPVSYLRPALDIPYCHHEKWDGTGYPRGLKGEEIPMVARLFALVDVWDALCSDRPYRSGWPKEKVLAHIRSLAGTHFDPQTVELFLQMLAEETG